LNIATLWLGDKLPRISLVALNSWIEQGHNVDLYSDREINNLPDGVTIKDANSVLPLSILDKLKPLIKTEYSPWQEIVSYSDLFRMRLMEKGLGIWLDTDIVLFRPFEPDPDKAWFALDGHRTIGVSALFFPSCDPIVTDFLKVLDCPNLIPNWLGFKRGVIKPMIFKLAMKPFSVTDLGITVFGNQALTKLVKQSGRLIEASPSEVFYLHTGKLTERFFDPKFHDEFQASSKVIGFHVHRKASSFKEPIEGSIYHTLVTRYGV
jgi:hypothetical protein